MSEYVVKAYEFSLAENCTREQFLQVSAEMDRFALTLEGFVYRSVAEQDDGRWLDICYWSSKEAANQEDKIMAQPFINDLMACLDEASVKSHKATIATQVYPEMHQAPPQ